jgi:hypothetical protein
MTSTRSRPRDTTEVPGEVVRHDFADERGGAGAGQDDPGPAVGQRLAEDAVDAGPRLLHGPGHLAPGLGLLPDLDGGPAVALLVVVH